MTELLQGTNTEYLPAKSPILHEQSSTVSCESAHTQALMPFQDRQIAAENEPVPE